LTSRLDEIKEIFASLGVWCEDNEIEMHLIAYGEDDPNDSKCVQVLPEVVEKV
jgi:hypothetical protein